MKTPKWDFEDSEVLEWALMTDRDPGQFGRLAITWPQERCDALSEFVQRFFGRRPQDRGSLQNLVRVLKGAREGRIARDREKREEAERIEVAEAHRKAMAEIIKLHPKGTLIAAGGGKSPGTKGP